MTRLLIRPKAESDLDDISDYIAAQSNDVTNLSMASSS